MNDEVSKSWYTKYRPKTMEEYSGPAIKKIVQKRFTKKSDMPHVIMIHGNRGCGKTTFARIISKYYQCLNPSEDGTPCEECEMCQSINETLIAGESGVECPGVIEVDATTANGKDAIQEVIEDAMQAPIYSQYKVIIFDECHMITAAAQNSLLKVIEDIPPHLVVIFATTNPEKVLQTIKSRCQITLEARKQTVDDMTNRLMQISKIEGLTVSQEALKVIAKKGNRVPRECINLLEDIAKTYAGDVSIDNVREHIGGVSAEYYMGYFKAANKSLSEILVFMNKLKVDDIKLDEFVTGLSSFVIDSMYIKNGISLEDYPVDYIKTVKELFDVYNSSEFDTLLQIIENLIKCMSDNDSKNELLLITTAMRVSKIVLIANGYDDIYSETLVENKLSLAENSKLIKTDNSEIIEQLKIEISPDTLKDEFDVSTVTDTAGLLDNIEIPLVTDTNTDDGDGSQENNDTGLGSEIDEFFDN